MYHFRRFPSLLLAVVAAEASLTYRSVDWSSTLVEERAGVVYSNAELHSEPLEKILVKSGVNMVRQRLWTVDGDYGIEYNIKLARRAHNAGLLFGLNLHFSDTWTNPGMQTIPSGWPEDITGLSTKLYNYTLGVCNRFAAAGLVPETITIGNEISSGMLWPTGKYDQPGNLSLLLKMASSAIRDSDLRPWPKIQIHLNAGQQWDLQHWFYDLVLGAGSLTLADFDMQGVSFYPVWGEDATMANLNTSLSNLVAKCGKEVMVLETNWPTVCSNQAPEYPFPPDAKDIPLSAKGQTIWIERLAAVVSGVSSGMGLSYWEPAWIHNAALGTECESEVMFGPDGRAYDSIVVFKAI